MNQINNSFSVIANSCLVASLCAGNAERFDVAASLVSRAGDTIESAHFRFRRLSALRAPHL